MDTRFRLYMLFPLVLFFVAFVVDKVFFLGNFPDYFMRTASFLNYDHKEVLRSQLKEYLQLEGRKKTIVIFGNSRTMNFDNKYIEKNYPDWILFNFSVPGGTSDFYAYHMGKFAEENISPDVILFAVTPHGFNTMPSIAMDEVILNGLSASFIINHIDQYTVDELTNYVAKKLFWSYRNKPHFSEIRKRLKENSQLAKKYNEFVEVSRQRLLNERGSVPYHINKEIRHSKEDFLVKDAQNTYRTFLNPFSLSEGQIRFTDESLKISGKLGSETVLLWAKVAPELRRLIDEEPVINDSENRTVREIWEPRIRQLSQKYDAPLLDLNYEDKIACDMFYDASHMAGYCFHDFTDYIMSKVQTFDREKQKK